MYLDTSHPRITDPALGKSGKRINFKPPKLRACDWPKKNLETLHFFVASPGLVFRILNN